MLPYGRVSRSDIIYGGPGAMYVGLEIKSAKGAGIYSRVEICAYDDGTKKSWSSHAEKSEENTIV